MSKGIRTSDSTNQNAIGSRQCNVQGSPVFLGAFFHISRNASSVLFRVSVKLQFVSCLNDYFVLNYFINIFASYKNIFELGNWNELCKNKMISLYLDEAVNKFITI